MSYTFSPSCLPLPRPSASYIAHHLVSPTEVCNKCPTPAGAPPLCMELRKNPGKKREGKPPQQCFPSSIEARHYIINFWDTSLKTPNTVVK